MGPWADKKISKNDLEQRKNFKTIGPKKCRIPPSPSLRGNPQDYGQ